VLYPLSYVGGDVCANVREIHPSGRSPTIAVYTRGASPGRVHAAQCSRSWSKGACDLIERVDAHSDPDEVIGEAACCSSS
jgi:hypothetical protein